LVENYWLAPRVFRHTIDLSPPAVIVSALIGGSLAGFAGVLIALPVAATAKVILNDMWLQQRMHETQEVPTADDEAGHPT
jgi:predicted PurR-regulated permease PerM